MSNKSFIAGAIFVLSAIFPPVGSLTSLKFTNVKCTDHDMSFSHFDQCELSVVGRGVISLNMRVALYKTPLTNATISVAVYKRANGYRPFLYNVSQDMCAFFANRKRYPILRVLFDLVANHSNLNHTCPYYEDIIIKDLVMEEYMFRHLPLPCGQYLYKIALYAYNDLKATADIFFNRNE